MRRRLERAEQRRGVVRDATNEPAPDQEQDDHTDQGEDDRCHTKIVTEGQRRLKTRGKRSFRTPS